MENKINDFGYEHVCVYCDKSLDKESDVGALVVGRGLSCQSCEDEYWEDKMNPTFDYWCSECESEFSSEIPIDDDVKRICSDCRF